jgi:peptidyl-prolyl cis-trans isomerase SurA
MQLLTKLFPGAVRRLLMPLVAGLLVAQAAPAQNLFAPVVRVDDMVVTEYEVQQRVRFLELLNAPGATREAVIDDLIDDRLRSRAATQAGLELTEEGLRESLAEFAARAELTTEEFVQALTQAGVAEETFRDFVTTQALWRELIRGRYNRRVDISEADIEAELAEAPRGEGIRVLVSEIIIPAPPQEAARVRALAARIAQSQTEAEFSNFARQYSATASRGAGGRLPWQDIERLPPTLRPLLLDLAPGEVTAPLSIPNAVALFQLRGIEETGQPATRYSEIDYATYLIPGGRSEAGLANAARVTAQLDRCDDLYGIAQGQPPEVLTRQSQAPGEIPQDIALELAKLDRNEVSTSLTRNNGQALLLVMLCNRVAEAQAEVSREQVQGALRQEILQGFAARLTAQLRADARIIYP